MVAGAVVLGTVVVGVGAGAGEVALPAGVGVEDEGVVGELAAGLDRGGAVVDPMPVVGCTRGR